MRHFLTLKDYTKEEILEILALGFKIKKKLRKGKFPPYLKKQTLAMIFEKSSTRTRMSFETGMYQLGGHAIFLSSNDSQLGRGEPMKDTARVVSRMADMVMIRTFSQESLEEFAHYATVPVINGLTDLYHPVQLLADYMTMIEHGKADEPVVAYVGDGNNMTHSWMWLAAKLGFELRVASPPGYEADGIVIHETVTEAKKSGAKITFFHDPAEAVQGADVVTTDTWISMGQEEEKEQRTRDFEGFIVDDAMMALAKPDAIFLHCLPAYRGYEVSETVLEGPQSVIFDEAENRLHAQKGLMVWLDKQRNED
jgi:ornithine carbamoyltransferase